MNLLTNNTPLGLWQEVIKHAEGRLSITLNKRLENYLVKLLIHYTDKPELIKQVVAHGFLQGMQEPQKQRPVSLQNVGDQCLLFAGLFPGVAERRCVKISYFVDMGRSAYAAVSCETNDLFNLLALQFVILMDVLQSIQDSSPLLPITAYDQWNEVGSVRALQILKTYTQGIPIKPIIK